MSLPTTPLGRRVLLFSGFALLSLGLSQHSRAESTSRKYHPADQGQRPRAERILPEELLRGYDPITMYFASDRGPGPGPADDGKKLLRIEPSWPGAWTWQDRRTLQFRPAEPWPPLRRFMVQSGRNKAVLTTMMSAPVAMQPRSGTIDLKPFRSLQLTFAQTLPLDALRSMIQLELRDPPGLADAPRQAIDDFGLTLLPRKSQHDQAVYAITLDDEIPEGKELHVRVSLALGSGDKTLWSGRLSTRPQFHLAQIQCGSDSLKMFSDLRSPKATALACGNQGQRPRLIFSAALGELSLSQVKRLVRLEPAVAGLHFRQSGAQLALEGRFVPDILYRMQLKNAPIVDASGRPLQDPGATELYFYLGWKKPFVRWEQAQNIVESKGPRQLPLLGYAEARADVRIYKIDPYHKGLWPFPNQPVVINEQSAPPFPGEEPSLDADKLNVHYVGTRDLQQHLRMLGSPLVSRVVDLPLAKHGGSTHFGLDLGPLLDPVVGRQQPGHYLVGLRRLSGDPTRSYVRMQVTNLSLSAVEDQDELVLFVRSLDTGEPVVGAQVKLEFIVTPKDKKKRSLPAQIFTARGRSDSRGELRFRPNQKWDRAYRISVRQGDDVLVIDPRDPPPRFADNHWSPSGHWLQWLTERPPPSRNDALLGFVFTERPIYRPGETVFIKAFVRNKKAGLLSSPGDLRKFGLKVTGPGDGEWTLLPETSALGALEAPFVREGIPTGRYQVRLFQIKPYRQLARREFQIEAYRIPTFEVQLAGAATVRLDKPFEIKAAARYYAGGALGEVPISWKISQFPYHYVPKGRPGFLFADSNQFARPETARRNQSQRQDGQLDKQGGASLHIDPSLDMDGSARTYRAEATVTDVDNQQVTAVLETRALPPFVLGLKLQRYAAAAKRIAPKIIAVGVDGKLLAGQDVAVKLYRRMWHSHLRETDFSTGKAEYFTEQEDKLLKTHRVKTQKKALTVPFKIKEAGVYVVELVAKDRLGRVQTLSADLYTGGKEALSWTKPQHGLFELATDKKTYKPGETARLIIKSPFSKAWALVVEEQAKGNQYSWLRVEGGKAVHSIKVRAEHVPNLPIHVLLSRGRIKGQAQQGSDDRYRPRSLAASLDLEIEPVQNKVVVEVKHPETQRPGSLTNFDISLKNEKGRPLSGEVTLWLVDEAVLSLAKEEPLDPLRQFIVRNRRRSSIRDSRNLVVGRLLEREESPGGDGEEDEEGAGSSRRVVRKNFKTVPYYKATLKVGASGKLRVPIKLSDDLSNFKVRAVVASGFSRFGLFEDRLRVRLPVLVQPQLPRFVRMGDHFWAGGVARLVEGAEGPGTVSLKIDGPVQGQAGRSKVQLRMGQASGQLFAYTAQSVNPEANTQLTFTMEVSRDSDGVGDAFQVKIPLLPDVETERHAEIVQLKAGTQKLKAFAENPRTGSGQYTVAITSVPGLLQALAGLDALQAYPHGCAEQKMSALMARMEIAQLLEAMGMVERNAGLLRQLQRFIDELKLYQDDQGFIAYWPGGHGEIALTAQSLEFLHTARGLGAKVPQRLQDDVVTALQAVLRSDNVRVMSDWRYNQHSAALRALGLVNLDDENYLIDLFHQQERMDLSSLAALAQTMVRRPSLYKSNLQAMRERLWRSVEFKLVRGQRVVSGLRWVRRWGDSLYLGSSTATLSEVLNALSLLDPDDARLPLLAQSLIDRAHAWGGFGSTYDNRVAIKALSQFLRRGAKDKVTARLRLAGTELVLDATHRIAKLSKKSDQNPQVNLVQGKDLALRVSSSSMPKTPGTKLGALREGFVLSRSTSLYSSAGNAPSHRDDQQGAVLGMQVGDVVELHTTLVSDQDRHHVALVVPFAAGLEYMNPDLETASSEAKPSQADSIRADYVQRLDHELRYYFFTLPAGSHSVHFRARATVEGRFVEPAPRAEQMYHPEVRGRAVGSVIEVKGEHQK